MHRLTVVEQLVGVHEMTPAVWAVIGPLEGRDGGPRGRSPPRRVWFDVRRIEADYVAIHGQHAAHCRTARVIVCTN